MRVMALGVVVCNALEHNLLPDWPVLVNRDSKQVVTSSNIRLVNVADRCVPSLDGGVVLRNRLLIARELMRHLSASGVDLANDYLVKAKEHQLTKLQLTESAPHDPVTVTRNQLEKDRVVQLANAVRNNPHLMEPPYQDTYVPEPRPAWIRRINSLQYPVELMISSFYSGAEWIRYLPKRMSGEEAKLRRWNKPPLPASGFVSDTMVLLGGRTIVHCFPSDQQIERLTGRKMPFPIRSQHRSVLINQHRIGRELPDMPGFMGATCQTVYGVTENRTMDPVYLSAGGIIAVVPFSCKLHTTMDLNLFRQVFNLSLNFSVEIFLPSQVAQDAIFKSLQRHIAAGNGGSPLEDSSHPGTSPNWYLYKTLEERSIPLKSVSGSSYREEWIGQLLSVTDQNNYYCTLERLLEKSPSMVERFSGFNGPVVCINPGGIETADMFILPFLGYHDEETTLIVNKEAVEGSGTGVYVCSGGQWVEYSHGFWKRLKKRFWRPDDEEGAWNDCRKHQRAAEYRKSGAGKQLAFPVKIKWSQETLTVANK